MNLQENQNDCKILQRHIVYRLSRKKSYASVFQKKEKETKYIVEKFLKKRIFNKQIQYLVKWKNYNIDKSTWELEKKLIEDLGKQHFDDLLKQMKK